MKLTGKGGLRGNTMNKLSALVFCSVMGATLSVTSGCAALVAGAAGAGAGVAIGSDSRTFENMVYDENIEQAGNDVLSSNKILSKSEVFNVTIYSMSGNVLLVGQTTNSDYLKWCVDQISRLNYVRKVYNYVQIKAPVSATQVASDSYLTSQIKAKLLFSDNIRSNRFKVVTEDSEVFLMGLVTEDEAKRAVNQVLTFKGVKKVYTIFDYITDQANLKETGYVTTDRIEIERAAPSGGTVSPSSTYVAPVDNSANGGAMIVEDSDLLAPAPALESGY